MERDYASIPEEMASERRWTLWKLERRDGKQTKIPLCARGGFAKSNDPGTWATFEEALGSDLEDAVGLGFMLGNGWVGIDIDHVDEDESGEASACLDDCLVSLSGYGEKSQSGKGYHFIAKGTLPKGRKRRGSIEMYSEKRFFAITGDCFKNDPFVDETETLKALHAKYLGGEGKKAEAPSAPVPLPQALSQNEIFGIAMRNQRFSALWNGDWERLYPDHSSADLAFCSDLAFYFGSNPRIVDEYFRASGMYREKWDEFRGEETYGQMTVKLACETTRNNFGSKEYEEEKKKSFSFSIARKEKASYGFDDTGNAYRFRDAFEGELRYNCSSKKWMVWDGKAWRQDDRQAVKSKADALLGNMKKEALEEIKKDAIAEMEGSKKDGKGQEMLKNAKRVASSSGKEAMLKEAQHLSPFPVLASDFDQSPTLVNCENGVLDLETLELRPHDKGDMMSKCTNVPVDFEHEPKAFLKALSDIFGGDKDVIHFIHKALGYTLSGETVEQCLFQCYGDGSTGKSTFFDAVGNAMGEYASNAQIDTFLARGGSNGSNASPDVARLAGSRFVRTNEPNQGDRFNEGFLKQCTGGDMVTARQLYGESFDFKSQMKLWIATNYKIEVRGTDNGVWRRQRLIPFEVRFEGSKKDKFLGEKLKAEAPQILGWMARGYRLWKEEGLEMPKKIAEATTEYKTEMDTVASFAEACLSKKQGAREKASDVFKEYLKWAKESNEFGKMSQTMFGKKLSETFKKKTIGGYVFYENCRLKRKEKGYVFIRGTED